MTIRSGIVVCGLSLAISMQLAVADTFIVTNTTDSGAGSLRQAITDANGHVNIDPNTPDVISFAIPGAGVQTITPGSPLPSITDPAVIDGYTQPGASPNTLSVGSNAVLLIELNGANTTGTAIGLDLTGGKSTVRGLIINRFGTSSGAFFGSGGMRLASDDNVVAGNFIGSNAAGSAGLANFLYGVTIDSGANNLVGGITPADRNLFAGNNTEASAGSGTGLQIRTTQSGTRVQGNYIGTNAAGNAPLGNGRGIDVVGFDPASIIIGGLTTTPGTGAGNVISGNSANGGIDSYGIYISNRTGDLSILGNIIGLDAAGTAALANGVSGIYFQDASPGSSVLLVGGTASGARNVIFNNRITGIVSNAIGLVVQGNYIGTDITGTLKPPSAVGGGDGILVSGGSVTIGGDSAAAANVISCHGRGLHINSTATATVQGNYIGTTADGVTPLGNDSTGLRVANSAVVTVGGIAPGQGNVITSNFLAGIAVKDTAHVTILGNSIFGNGTDPSTIGHPGIDLGDDFVTPNDTGDVDTGPNNLQNYPVLRSTTFSAGMVQVTGSLNSTASTTFRLEFFGNDRVNPLGFGEGRYFLGFANVITDANGDATFDVSFPVTSGAAHITATATDPTGNTSEFSAAIGQLLNISSRLRVQTGENVLIAGFIITGTDAKKVIVRGIGPSLAQFIQDFLADPVLELHGPAKFSTIINDNWRSDQQTEIEATGIAPTNDLESAIVATLPANNAYTAIVRGKDNTIGVGVVEAYDLDTAVNSKLANISTRGLVETGNDVLIGGFIAGNGVTKVVIRAIGPSLSNAGVSNPLLDPTVELHDGNGITVATNNNWKINDAGGSQQAEVEATTIPPTDDRESAIVRSLLPGNYTAVVRGVDNTIGVAVVEVYNIQ